MSDKDWTIESAKSVKNDWWLSFLKENSIFDTERIKQRLDWIMLQAELYNDPQTQLYLEIGKATEWWFRESNGTPVYSVNDILKLWRETK